ncbi:MAG: fatty acid desaturase [Bacteriovoracaceae bacterium]|nr:fatty acid desaturase [Bacteriovoracaceae bacterium]
MKRDFLLDLLGPIHRPGTVLSTKEHWMNFLKGINIFKSKKNWISLANVLATVLMIVPTILFFKDYFTWGLMGIVVLVNALILNIYSTFYYHRFCSHKAFKVKNKFSLLILKNLAPKFFIEEVFTMAHQVHHKYSDTDSDPHNAQHGQLHCFLSDVTQMRLNPDLDEKGYERAKALMAHTGIEAHSFEKYQEWGTVTKPINTVVHFVLNWTFWSLLIFSIGGMALLTAVATAGFFWGLAVRNFNYKSHGSGEDLRKDWRDTDKDTLSLNLIMPGTLCGEWHANHHIYPTSARCDFLPWQIDLAFASVWSLKKLGVVESYIDKKEEYKKVYLSKKECDHGRISNPA